MIWPDVSFCCQSVDKVGGRGRSPWKGSDQRASYAIVSGRSVAFDRWLGRLEAIKTEGARPWFVRQERALRFTPIEAIFLSVDRSDH